MTRSLARIFLEALLTAVCVAAAGAPAFGPDPQTSLDPYSTFSLIER